MSGLEVVIVISIALFLTGFAAVSPNFEKRLNESICNVIRLIPGMSLMVYIGTLVTIVVFRITNLDALSAFGVKSLEYSELVVLLAICPLLLSQMGPIISAIFVLFVAMQHGQDIGLAGHLICISAVFLGITRDVFARQVSPTLLTRPNELPAKIRDIGIIVLSIGFIVAAGIAFIKADLVRPEFSSLFGIKFTTVGIKLVCITTVLAWFGVIGGIVPPLMLLGIIIPSICLTWVTVPISELYLPITVATTTLIALCAAASHQHRRMPRLRF